MANCPTGGSRLHCKSWHSSSNTKSPLMTRCKFKHTTCISCGSAGQSRVRIIQQWRRYWTFSRKLCLSGRPCDATIQSRTGSISSFLF
jgi:hypothetical protein